MAEPRSSGLFFSSLDPQQTTGHQGAGRPRYRPVVTEADRDFDRRASREAFRVQPASDVETAFRHAGWLDDRERVRAALVAANVPQSRLERFDGCGSDCVVEHSREAGRFRVRASYCGDRFCLPCCVSRSKKIQANLLAWCKGERVRFVTLTLRQTSQPLASTLSHLLASFKRLRRQQTWKSAVRAGTAVVEIKRGTSGACWNVHLHVLVVGGFLDQRALSDAWKEASRGSFIVDVRAVRDHSQAVGYVAKYATKGWSENVVADADSLVECIIALRGRRLLLSFGEWYDRDELERPMEPSDWKRIGRIGDIYFDAIRGREWALGCLRALGFAAGQVNGRPVFVGAAAPWSGP